MSLTVRAILGSGLFWLDPDPRVQAITVADWCKSFQGLTPEQVLAAWRQYQRTGPRKPNGKLEPPTAEDIRARHMTEVRMQGYGRPQAWIDPPKPDHRKTVTKDEAERILARAGYTQTHTDLVKRFPTARSRADIEDRRSILAGAEQETRAAIDPEELRRARMATEIGRAALGEKA